MSATFYHINTTLAATGQTHQSDYWPDGQGQHYAGYVTSMAQLCAELRRKLTASNLGLYVVTADGHAKLVADDDELREAVESLPDRGVLSVTAVETSGGKRNNRRHRRRRHDADDDDGDWNATTGKWYDQEYTTDDDEDDWENDGDTASDDQSDWNAEHVTTGLRVETAAKKVKDIVRRFDAYETLADAYADADAECYHCDTTEWKGGVRYCYAENDDYNLCSKCYKELPKSQKKDWEKAAVVGASMWGSDAPSYPLYREDEPTVSASVRQLQYILTRLGLMPLSATDEVVGSYQSHTEKAVRRFREQYGLRGGNMSVYDAKTARKMGEVVRQLRSQGHKHI